MIRYLMEEGKARNNRILEQEKMDMILEERVGEEQKVTLAIQCGDMEMRRIFLLEDITNLQRREP